MCPHDEDNNAGYRLKSVVVGVFIIVFVSVCESRENEHVLVRDQEGC